MSTDKQHYSYESFYGGEQEVALMISAYTMNDNIYVGLRAVEPDGSTRRYADLTVNIPSAPALEPFHAAIDIEHLGQLDAMNFLSENGLADHTGKTLPSGYMAFPVYEFDAEKLAKADPEGFKNYLKIVGLDEKQIEENSVGDLAAMAKACFHEKTAGEEPALPSDERPEFQFGEKVELPFGEGSLMGSFEQMLEILRDDDSPEEDFAEPGVPEAGLADVGSDGFLRYCEREGLDPGDVGPREGADSLEDAKRQAKERASEKNAGHSERDSSKPSPDVEL